jgi:prevent-host-death family protein
MKELSISKGIIPVGEFKTSISKWLKDIQQTDHPLVITQNGRPAGVLLSPHEYDNLTYKNQFIESVARGIDDAETGKVYSKEQIHIELEKARSSRKK